MEEEKIGLKVFILSGILLATLIDTEKQLSIAFLLTTCTEHKFSDDARLFNIMMESQQRSREKSLF